VADRPDDRGDAPPETEPAGPTETRASRGIRRYWWVAGLAIVVLVVIVLVPYASGDPDGLQRVAQDNGFLGSAQDPGFSLIPGYAVPGVGGNLSKVIAGLVGVAVIFGLIVVLGRVLARRRR